MGVQDRSIQCEVITKWSSGCENTCGHLLPLFKYEKKMKPFFGGTQERNEGLTFLT